MPSKANNTIHKLMNTSLSSKRHPFIRSALEKNFKASASSKNPNETFTAFNQPPAWPSLFNKLGKKANNAKGSASASENANMPTSGP